MPNQDLLNYIQKKLEKGSSMEEIKGILLGHGWQEELVDEAFIYLRLNTTPDKIETPTPLTEEINSLLQETNLTETKIESPAPEVTPENEEPITSSPQHETTPIINEVKIETSKYEKPKIEFLKEIVKPSPKNRLIIIFVILLLIIGGISFGYYYSKEPLLVLSKAIDTTQNIKSIETENQLKITLDDVLLQEMNQNSSIAMEKEYTINTNIAFDYLDVENIKLKQVVSVLNDSLNAEISFVNKVLYGKINKIDIDSTKYGLPVHQTIKDHFINKWVKITDLSKDDLYSNLKTNIQKVTQSKTEIMALVKNHPQIIKTIKRMPSEKIAGIDTHHYKIEIDKNNVVDALVEYATSKTGEQTQAEEINSLKENFDRYVSINNFEIWIGKKDNLIYKSLLDVEIKGLTASEETTTSGSVNIQLTTNTYNHNLPLAISEPQEYINVEELMMALVSSRPESYTKDALIKTSMDQIRSTAETYRTNNSQYSNKIINNTQCNITLAKTFLENSTGGYALCETIQSNSSGAFNIRINNLKGADAKYCIQKALNSNQTWCIDSTGYAGYETNCDSVSFDCKK
jgi:hypothetical protein